MQTELLVRSRRRCALCFGLDRNDEAQRGQIAHIDRDSSNSSIDNLVWLCLPHHDEYDSRSSQSKGITPSELKVHRETLYELLRRDDHPPPQAPSESIFALPSTHRQNPHFVASAEIEAALRSLAPGDAFVLHGLGGVGKTQQAVQHAHVHRADYRVVLWAVADSPQGFHDSLAALVESEALALGIGTNAETGAKTLALRRWMVAHSNWLLIIDNANSPEVVEAIERFIPPYHQGHVIITAQFSQWTEGFRAVQVGVWSDDQAVRFLEARLSGTAGSGDQFVQLAKMLGGLPLALEQAAAYLEQTRTLAGEYLRILAEDRKGLLALNYRGMTDYRASVAVVWLASTRRISLLGRHILQLLACLGPEPIPRRLLEFLPASVAHSGDYGPIERRQLSRAMSGPSAINLALAQIASYSLLSLATDSVRLHPLLQAVIRDTGDLNQRHIYYRFICKVARPKRAPETLWPIRAASLLARDGALPFEFPDQALSEVRSYAPHVDALVGQLPQDVFGNNIHVGRLYAKQRSYRDRVGTFDKGMKAVCDALNAAATRSPRLRDETDWFISACDDLVAQALEDEDESDSRLGIYIRGQARQEPDKSPFTVYDVLGVLARKMPSREHAIARRICRLWFEHATEDPTARPRECGYARISEGLVALQPATTTDLQGLFREGLGLLERAGRLTGDDACDAAWLFSLLSSTPEDIGLATTWLKLLMAYHRTTLAAGYWRLCRVADELVRLLRLSGQDAEALALCEDTLKLAIRSRKVRAEYTAGLWEYRGDLLRALNRFTGAARSYSRSLANEQTRTKPKPRRLVDLPVLVAEMRRLSTLERQDAQAIANSRSKLPSP